MFFCAFGMTRITKRLRLPSVTAYLTAGILIGPCCLNLIPQPMIEKTDFLADLALCFIAFSAGEFFKLETLRKNGWKVVWVTIAEACAASLVVFGVTRFLLGLNLPFCVVLAALASATAPASTMMTIRQTGAQGELVDTLLQVVALDDVVSLLAYSAAIAFALHSLTGRSSDPVGDLLVPIGTTLGMLILGGVCGLLLKWLLPATRTTDNRLILALGVLFAFCGLCDMLEVSPLLGCMSMAWCISTSPAMTCSLPSWQASPRPFCCSSSCGRGSALTSAPSSPPARMAPGRCSPSVFSTSLPASSESTSEPGWAAARPGSPSRSAAVWGWR